MEIASFERFKTPTTRTPQLPLQPMTTQSEANSVVEAQEVFRDPSFRQTRGARTRE